MIWNFYSNRKNGVLKVHIDSTAGPVIATVSIKAADKWRREFVEMTTQSGVHDVYLTYENPSLPEQTEEFAVVFDCFAFIPQLPAKEYWYEHGGRCKAPVAHHRN